MASHHPQVIKQLIPQEHRIPRQERGSPGTPQADAERRPWTEGLKVKNKQKKILYKELMRQMIQSTLSPDQVRFARVSSQVQGEQRSWYFFLNSGFMSLVGTETVSALAVLSLMVFPQTQVLFL